MTKVFKTPFAAQGDRKDVPVETQADGSVSYTQGYGYDYERDQTTDPAAKDIEREKMNALFHDVTEAVGEIQTFGTANWSEGGKPYPIRSLVYYGKRVWQSKIENNNEEPGKGSDWIELKATPDGLFLQKSQNLADVEDKVQSRENLQIYSRTETDNKYVFKSITINNKPLSSNINLTAADVGAWAKNESDNRYLMKAEGGHIEKPITIRNTSGAMLSLIRGEQGGVGGQFIGGYNNDGNRLWWMGSGGNGVRDVALYSDAWGMGVSITQNGINADGNLLERGARVYSPYNPQPSQTAASLASNGWWRDNGTGMIYQWVNGINLPAGSGAYTIVNFPIAFPVGCLVVNVSVIGAASEQIGWSEANNGNVKISKGSGDSLARTASIIVIGK
ncbi:MAG: hypothetical protein XXXJIFNMEKO3_01169 [Candidatus Erwinia impunctatus]|nr:hypothetical protein XXXJIFNMEKO_01169 [Culicoides impunctatus]